MVPEATSVHRIFTRLIPLLAPVHPVAAPGVKSNPVGGTPATSWPSHVSSPRSDRASLARDSVGLCERRMTATDAVSTEMTSASSAITTISSMSVNPASS